MKNEFKFITIENQKAVRWIRLNRPEVKNAFHLTMGRELLQAVQEGLKNRSVRVLILSGHGDSFSAGGDIKGMAGLKNNSARKQFFLEISCLINSTITAIHRSKKMVIAATPGYVGGVALGLFLAADFRIASHTALMNAATVKIGLVANGGSTFFLPRLVGWGHACDILFSGDKITAEHAQKIGMVTRVVTPENLVEETQRLAEQLAGAPQQALGKLKTILTASLQSTLPQQLERERQSIAWSSTTPDFLEGISAFLEKRRPDFQC